MSETQLTFFSDRHSHTVYAGAAETLLAERQRTRGGTTVNPDTGEVRLTKKGYRQRQEQLARSSSVHTPNPKTSQVPSTAEIETTEETNPSRHRLFHYSNSTAPGEQPSSYQPTQAELDEAYNLR